MQSPGEQGLDPDSAQRPDFAAASESVLAGDGWPATGPLLAMLQAQPLDVVERFPLRAGFVIAQELHRQGAAPTEDSVASALGMRRPDVSGRSYAGVALLWSDLRQLEDYKGWQHETEIQGVLARLVAHVDRWPEAWSLSAEAILARAARIGPHATDLLSLAALHHPGVRASLQRVATGDGSGVLRDRAEGVLARVQGVTLAGDELRRWLADTAARAFDGVPWFPHPLTPLARTWTGSTELEEMIARSVQRAASRFEMTVQDQGGIEEEALTMALLNELEFAFRDTKLQLEAGGRGKLSRAITVGQRPVAKNTEEPTWGCDVAFLVEAKIKGTFALEAAEIVQVKKSRSLSRRRATRTATDSWRIDLRQLMTILSVSASSCYWLISAAGEVACIPARVVYALGRGRAGLGQGSFTVGYNDLRHGAVGLEQFLPELLLGGWVGSVDEKHLRFARGEDGNIRPRHIFEIALSVGADDDG